MLSFQLMITDFLFFLFDLFLCFFNNSPISNPFRYNYTSSLSTVPSVFLLSACKFLSTSLWLILLPDKLSMFYFIIGSTSLMLSLLLFLCVSYYFQTSSNLISLIFCSLYFTGSNYLNYFDF